MVIWQRHMVKNHRLWEKTSCCHMDYSFWLTARVLLCPSSHRQDNTYHSLCYTSHGALAGTGNSSMGALHEGSIRRPIAPWANALTTDLCLAAFFRTKTSNKDIIKRKLSLSHTFIQTNNFSWHFAFNNLNNFFTFKSTSFSFFLFLIHTCMLVISWYNNTWHKSPRKPDNHSLLHPKRNKQG